MATAADIRVWAETEGMEVNERGRVPKDVREAYLLAHPDEEYGATETGNLDNYEPIKDIDGPTTPGEVRPDFKTPAKRSRFNRRSRTGKAKSKRTKLDRFGEHVFALGAKFVESRSIALSRILAMQSPVAGIIMEENIKHGGLLDKVIQPIARSEEKLSATYAMLGPMLMVVAIEKNPSLFPTLEGPLKLALLEWASIAEPAMKRVVEREQRLAEQFAEHDIDAMIKMIFSHMLIEEPADV